MSDPELEAIAAYWRFFEGTNSRDSRKFTETLNFPHVRVSARGWAGIVPDAATHARNNSFESLLAMGWDHTIGSEPEVLHAAPHKVHIKGGWTRYTKDNEPIISNLVTYIATEVDGHWGMQSRFGIDRDLPGPTTDPEASGEAGDAGFDRNVRDAEAIVGSALASVGVHDPGGAGNFHRPYLVVHAGRIESITDVGCEQHGVPETVRRASNVYALQAGPTGVSVAFEAGTGEHLVEGVFLVTVERDAWRIKSGSFVMRRRGCEAAMSHTGRGRSR